MTSGIKIALKSQIAKGFVLDGNIFFLKGFNLTSQDNKILVRAMEHTFDLNINLELYYIFNFKKYSYKSVYLFGENQKKSVGSFVGGLATGLVNFGTKNPLFETANDENKILDFRSINALTVSILGGYMHTFVFGKEKRWYLNGAAYIGPNIHIGSSSFYRDKETEGFLNVGFNFKYKFSFGHNFEKASLRVYSGGSFISYRPSKDSFLNNNIPEIKLAYIYKF